METFNKFTTKEEKRITITDLLEFINTNSKQIKNIDVVESSSASSSDDFDTDADTKLNDVLEVGKAGKLKFLPPNLSQLFTKFSNRFLHMGTLHNLDDTSKFDISFFTSVFYCLRYSFSSLDIDEQRIFINKFLEGFRKGISMGYFEEFGYNKLKWNKVEITKQVCDMVLTKCVMRYFADYLCVNIFILDITDDTFYYTGGDFIPYKKNIFLLKQDHYEPIITEQGRSFNAGDDVIKHILANKEFVQVFNLNFREKNGSANSFVIVVEDLSRYIDMTQFKIVDKKSTTENINGYDESECHDESANSTNSSCSDDGSTDDSSIDSDSETDNIQDIPKIPQSITIKSKLLDIQAVAKKLGITVSVSGKNKTKDVLYKEIMHHSINTDSKKPKGKK